MSPAFDDGYGEPDQMPPKPQGFDPDEAGVLSEESLEELGNRLAVESGALAKMVEEQGLTEAEASFPDFDALATEKAEFAADPRVRDAARNGDFWVHGTKATPGWYATWHPDEVYYRTQHGVWMTSMFTIGDPVHPVHKLGPASHDPLMPDEDNPIIAHARRELELVGEEHMTIDGILRIMQAFSDMGHSGGSASIVIPWLTKLLNFQNIRPLTDNPNEWTDVSGFSGDDSTWQSQRRPDAFSKDGGKTYYLLDEDRDEEGGLIFHTSQPHEKQEE